MAIKQVKLKTRNMFRDMNPDDADYQLWQNIAEYMDGEDSHFGVYIDDREEFDTDWDSGDYEPDGCHYLEPENVEILEG